MHSNPSVAVPPVSLKFKAHLALVVCSLLWGVTFVVVKDTLADISVFAYLTARFGLAAIPLAWIYRADLRKLSAAEMRAGLVLGAFMFGGYAFQTAGIARTTPSKAAFITGFSVVLVPVLMAIVWRRRITIWAWAGAVASLCGLYWLTVPSQGITNLNHGDLLVMGCAVLYAFQIIYISRYSGEFSLGGLSFLQVLVTAGFALLSVPLLSATKWEPLRVQFSGMMVFGVLVTAIFTTAIAYPLLVWAQTHTSRDQYGPNPGQRAGVCRRYVLRRFARTAGRACLSGRGADPGRNFNRRSEGYRAGASLHFR